MNVLLLLIAAHAGLLAGPMPTPTALEKAAYGVEGELHSFRPPRAKWSLLRPSDLGPEEIDVRGYSKSMRHAYQFIIKERCLRCHTAARIWNAPFVEIEGAELEKARKAQPWLFKTGHLVQAEPQIWRRYVKKMRQMPACCGGCSDMSDSEIKAMADFLIQDSLKRKIGAEGRKWAEHRGKLIKEFVRRKPESRPSYAEDLK